MTKPVKMKETPAEPMREIPKVPEQREPKELNPIPIEMVEGTPVGSALVEETPVESQLIETVPEASPNKEEMPSDFIEENCVVVDGIKVEIKPTKLKYFRNKAASAYGIIKAVPLHDLLTYGKGVIDEKRDADQLLYDFLVAVFDDPEFVKDHYDEMDADVIDRVCKIFGRLNHVDEKEEAARKNREAQAQQKR